MIDFSAPVTAGTVLVRSAIASPNYSAGVSGWTINQDGTVEFTSGTFRGTVNGGSFVGTDYVQNSLGTFFYNGTPAKGNLIASIAAQDGADDGLGNQFLQGVCTYSATVFTQQVGGALVMGAVNAGVPDTGHAGNVVSSGDALIINPPIRPDLGLGEGLNWEVTAGATNTPSGGPNVPTVSTTSSDQTSDVDWVTSGAVRKSTKNGNPYTWQTAALASGFTNLSLRYKLDAEDNIVVDGGFSMATAQTGAGAATITNAPLAAPYKSNRQSRIPCLWTSSGAVLKGVAMLLVNSDGSWSLQWSGATAANDRFYLSWGEAPIGQVG